MKYNITKVIRKKRNIELDEENQKKSIERNAG